jgi:hypothetical protein
MSEQSNRKRRTNRAFKSLHKPFKPLKYLGVERTLFYFVCVGAVGAFNLFNSILAGIGVFIAVCSEADAGAAFSSVGAAVCGDGKSAGISAG